VEALASVRHLPSVYGNSEFEAFGDPPGTLEEKFYGHGRAGFTRSFVE